MSEVGPDRGLEFPPVLGWRSRKANSAGRDLQVSKRQGVLHVAGYDWTPEWVGQRSQHEARKPRG